VEDTAVTQLAITAGLAVELVQTRLIQAVLGLSVKVETARKAQTSEHSETQAQGEAAAVLVLLDQSALLTLTSRQ
jgi:hypothetical protein